MLVDGSGNTLSNASTSQIWSVSPAAIAGERPIQRRALASATLNALLALTELDEVALVHFGVMVALLIGAKVPAEANPSSTALPRSLK